MPNPLGRRKPDDEDPFRDLFQDFDKEFRRMQEYFNQVFQEALKSADIPKGQARPGNPFVYGFTMRMGPDGRPHIEQFGNRPGALGRPEVAVEGGREPITDTVEHDDHVTVTAELPGVEREDVQVYATDDTLTIQVETAGRRYYKRLDLPAKVRPDSTAATFKNGVLDVTVKKVEPRPPEDRGFRVNVK